MNRYDVVVVGGGVSGLSCALRLHRAGASVLVVERGPEVGGVIRSHPVPEAEALLDHGPQTLRSGDPALLNEFAELGIAGDRVEAGAAGRNRYVLHDGILRPLPLSPGRFLTSPVLPLGGKLRLLAEPLVPTRTGVDESVDAFFRRRLGRHVAERLVDPFVSGVYAGDPLQLSMRAVFPGIKEGADGAGSLLRWGLRRARAARRARRAGEGEPRHRPTLFSFREGLGQWPRAVARALGEDRVVTGTWIREVARNGEGWTVSGVRDGASWRARGETLVLATPAAASAGLLEDDFPAEVRRLRDIPYAPVSTVHLVYRREAVAHPLDGFGALFPSSQGRSALGILFISSLFPGRVAPGHVLTTTFVGGARYPERALRTPDRLVELAHREHQELLGVSGAPVLARAITHRSAIPQYEFGHLDRVEAAERLEHSVAGLHLLGAYRGGVSVPDCWKNGRGVADRILEAAGAGAPDGSTAPGR